MGAAIKEKVQIELVSTPEESWKEALDPETRDLVERMIKDGFCRPPKVCGPPRLRKPLEIPGFSLTDCLIEMRRED